MPRSQAMPPTHLANKKTQTQQEDKHPTRGVFENDLVENTIISNHTGQSFDTVATDGERDKYFSAEEAKAYGLVDEVLEHNEEKKKD